MVRLLSVRFVRSFLPFIWFGRIAVRIAIGITIAIAIAIGIAVELNQIGPDWIGLD